ncbi:chromatin assembly factor 1 subunit FAS1-like [Zingiber officinale]|uniref:chromatin assembly factor 1 subunit FAS1-like n=1 Tax=Zingiber officinale TaxID=94328 RepID=UPI001C4BF4D7|nr:chromatin assembly factor 1 subunit FAS1-like [Zingiber officinale]
MTSPGAAVTDKTDECKLSKVVRGDMVLDICSGKEEDKVVLNRALENYEDLMVLDDSLTEATERESTKDHLDEKSIHSTNSTGLPCGSVLSSNRPSKLVQDVGEKVKRQAELKDEQNGGKKNLKRKRIDGEMIHNNESLITQCQQELDELVDYFKEFSGLKLQLDDVNSFSNNSMIAFLLEERNLPFSNLAEEIYEKLKEREAVTLASVRCTLLSIGQRVMYGITSPDTDVLEDKSDLCLWCWETRDAKLLPASLRSVVHIRRIARNKIHKRISTLHETLSALANSPQTESYKADLIQASIKLRKVLNKQGISMLVDRLSQKNNADMAKKEARLQEKELIKAFEKTNQSAEKEKKKLERELQKEKLQNEKELKRMQEEAERERKRHEKEQIELKKQIKKQQEEAAREQRRREKEEAELKKQRAVQKQASMMELFLKSKSSHNSDIPDGKSPMIKPSTEIASNEEMLNAVTSSMDVALHQQHNMTIEDLRRFHVDGWRKLAHCNRSSCWGVRHNPKANLTKEIKLQKSSLLGETHKKSAAPKIEKSSCEVISYSLSSSDRLDEELESLADSMSSQNDLVVTSTSAHSLKKKLLQFDKSNRPAYYGTWRRKSLVVGQRHPLRKDPELDYDVDSDEEWEEEAPGESLSDCDKMDEESIEGETLENENDCESEDSFVVPDGYLSETEGVQLTPTDCTENEVKNSSTCKLETDDVAKLLWQQKVLFNLTEKALRKSQPLVISNLNHELSELRITEELSGTAKIEQICLQALCMVAFPGCPIIYVSPNPSTLNEVQQVSESSQETSTQPGTSEVISELDLPEFVRLVQSCPHGINKMVEVLQQKFPSISKTQLRNKVREISSFVDNHWQVKKDILERLGMPATESSPDTVKKQKSIAAYFSKRCLPPPEVVPMILSESLPESSLKSKTQDLKAEGESAE